ncbi:MAG: methyltransferase type 11 [uncultured bacterium]|nr:MAG: methyltransferase type 11 [uncultured bacterium]
MFDWDKRMKNESETLASIFKKNKIKNLIDLGVWTGEYTIRLAKKLLCQILGLDHNSLMIKLCEAKKEKLEPIIKKRVSFMLSDFTNLPNTINHKYDSAICMGNALPYLPTIPIKLFKEVSSVLKNDGLIIIQMLNLEKILKTEDKLISFDIQKTQQNHQKEYLSLEFFDSKKQDDFLTHHIIIFDSDGENWSFKGVTSIPVRYITKNDLEKALVQAGFAEIAISGSIGKYQNDYGELSFSKPFDVENDDFLNILAKKNNII